MFQCERLDSVLFPYLFVLMSVVLGRSSAETDLELWEKASTQLKNKTKHFYVAGN